MGLTAAYSADGEEWLDALRGYLHDNYRWFCDFMRKELSECPVTELEATYLPWVDVRCLGLTSEEIEEVLVRDNKVWVNAGEMYGEGGYIRINLACPRSRLREGMHRVAAGLKSLMTRKQ